MVHIVEHDNSYKLLFSHQEMVSDLLLAGTCSEETLKSLKNVVYALLQIETSRDPEVILAKMYTALKTWVGENGITSRPESSLYNFKWQRI